MPLAVFIVVVSVIGILWVVKLTDVMKKASQADSNEEKKDAK